MNKFCWAFIPFVLSCLTVEVSSRSLHGGGLSGEAPPSSSFIPIKIYNTSSSPVTDAVATTAHPMILGELPSGSKYQLYDSDQITTLTTQQDGESTWRQDGSVKNANLAFPPLSFSGASKTLYAKVVSGTPNRTTKVTISNITSNTDFRLVSNDVTRADGTAETGTYEFVSLNYVLTNCAQYSNSTGYGSNPKCGWEYYAKGPNLVGVHAWQYARKTGSANFNGWIRTELYVAFTGSGSNPCKFKCSITTYTTQPNIFGKVSGATLGPSTEGGYVYSAILYNGSSVLYNWGGSNDVRTIRNLNGSNFSSARNLLTMPRGNAYEHTAGVFAVRFTSTGTCGSLTCGALYYIQAHGAVDPFASADETIIYRYRCAPNGNGCGAPITLTTPPTGTVTMTAYVSSTRKTGWQGLDQIAQRIWVSSAGTVTTAPPILIGKDFSHLMKTRATSPYIESLVGKGLAVTNPRTYYPNSYYLPLDLNTTGDGPGDNRIAPIDHDGALALFDPNDINAEINSATLAASFSSYHMYNLDETTGMPVVFNNGHAKNGVTYATLGAVQPAARTYPYQRGKWASFSTAAVDQDEFSERYGVWVDGSHLPAPMQQELLRTGNPEWLFMLSQEANAWLGNGQTPSETVAGVIYHRSGSLLGNNQTRGIAWGSRTLDQWEYFESNAALTQYIRDIEEDDAGYLNAIHNVANGVNLAVFAAYGMHVNDTVHNPSPGIPPWPNDFNWWRTVMMALRGEHTGFNTFATRYYYKYALGRMNSATGGCLWAGPARAGAPYTGFVYNPDKLASTWDHYYANTGYNITLASNFTGTISANTLNVSSINQIGSAGGFGPGGGLIPGRTVYVGTAKVGDITAFGTGGGATGTYTLNTSSTYTRQAMHAHVDNEGWTKPGAWTSCPSSGLILDPGGTFQNSPSSLATFAAMTAGMADQLGITGAAGIYDAIRAVQYGDAVPLTFTRYRNGNVNTPPYTYFEFAIGKRGAVNFAPVNDYTGAVNDDWEPKLMRRFRP